MQVQMRSVRARWAARARSPEVQEAGHVRGTAPVRSALGQAGQQAHGLSERIREAASGEQTSQASRPIAEAECPSGLRSGRVSFIQGGDAKFRGLEPHQEGSYLLDARRATALYRTADKDR